MTRLETILLALTARIAAAGVAVVRNSGQVQESPDAGLVILHDGVPGEPEFTLSPMTWHYRHQAQADLWVPGLARSDAQIEAAFDVVVTAIGVALAADPTLGGLCDWVEATAPEVTAFDEDGGERGKAAVLSIVLHYATTNPLG